MTYVDVNGLPTWHEVRGEGQPIVLLHGAFAGASSWSAPAPALAAAGYKVHVPERRGHGHTPDVEGPMTYQVMADDTVAYFDGVVGGPAHLVGWSDGAVVALLVARGRPDLVDRLVLIGQYYSSSGKVTGGLTDQLSAGGGQLMGSCGPNTTRSPRTARSTSRWCTPRRCGCLPLNPSSSWRP